MPVNEKATSEEAGLKAVKASELKPWQVIASRQVFDSPPWIRISIQEVRLPDGTVVKDYRQIELPDSVAVFAQTVDGRVIVERQYKHGVRGITLVMPAGSIESGEPALEAAQRELLEETGYRSECWKPLGTFVGHGNFGCGKAYIFMAKDAHRVAEPKSGDLEEMEILLMKPSELQDALLQGKVVTLGSVAAIALGQLSLSGTA